MSRTFTVAQLRARAQVLADDENAVLASSAQYDVWIGESYAWLWDLLVGSGIYPALSTHTITAGGVAATGYLSIYGTVSNNETVTIGATTYTFKTALTPAANEVLINASPITSISNLVAAINAGSGAGTLYGTGTVAHTTVSAEVYSSVSFVVAKLTARTAGSAGNSIATTETITNGGFVSATLSDGTDEAGTQNFALATDNYAVLAVQYQQGDVWIPLEPLHVSDWHRYDTGDTGIARKYLVHGAEGTTQRIRLFPTPETGGVYRVIYVPRPALPSSADTIDGVAGWEQLIAIDVAIKAGLREKSSVTDLVRERQLLLDRIDRMKFERSLGQLRMPDAGEAFFDAASVGRVRRPW